MVNGKTKICGIMGCPVAHSLSPMMHNYFAAQTGIDMMYVPFPVRPEQVEEAVAGAHALNIQGMNVTIPHKQAVIPFLRRIDDAAKAVGAVNTLVPVAGGYMGYNTDAPGLFRAMEEAGMTVEGKVCIILGAGGAAKAAAYVAGSHGAENVYILNRNEGKAMSLAGEMNTHFGRDIFIPLAIEQWKEINETSCLAIQTTSVGMYPYGEAAPIEDKAFFEKLSAVFDVIYTPAETRFMKLAKACGVRTCGGLGMLLYQGVVAYELWNPETKLTEQVIAGARQLLLEQLGDQ